MERFLCKPLKPWVVVERVRHVAAEAAVLLPPAAGLSSPPRPPRRSASRTQSSTAAPPPVGDAGPDDASSERTAVRRVSFAKKAKRVLRKAGSMPGLLFYHGHAPAASPSPPPPPPQPAQAPARGLCGQRRGHRAAGGGASGRQCRWPGRCCSGLRLPRHGAPSAPSRRGGRDDGGGGGRCRPATATSPRAGAKPLRRAVPAWSDA